MPASRGGRASLHFEAEVTAAADEMVGELGLVTAGEVIGAEVMVIDIPEEHVVGGGEHGRGDGKDRFLGAAAALEAEELDLEVGVAGPDSGPGGLDQGGLEPGVPGRVRVERRLPALSCSCGQRPAQESRWPAVGKRVMSRPISARITRATVVLIPAWWSRGRWRPERERGPRPGAPLPRARPLPGSRSGSGAAAAGSDDGR